jgi:hypothetical protein
LEIIVFDASETLSSISLEVSCDTIHDLEIIEDVLGLADLISKYQEVVFTAGVFDLKQKNDLQKIERQVVNIIDTCLFLNKPLYIIAPFTPYYGNTQLKNIHENSINESSDLDDFSLHLHQIAQEVERGRQEGGLLTFIRTGLDLNKDCKFPMNLSKLYQWRTFPTTSTMDILSTLRKLLKDSENPNSNIILVSSFLLETDFPEITLNKKSLVQQFKSIFKKEKYSNSLPIQLDTLLSRSV